MNIKITYIISNINKSLAFEWIAQCLDKNKYQLQFILLNNSETELEKFLLKNNLYVKRINYNNKVDLIKAFFKITFELIKNRPDIVHAHLFEASFIGLLVAKILGIKQRIYTRHHSTLNHVYFPHAVKYDKFINWCSTHIIAISENVKNILIEKENVDDKKVVVIHHGFKIEEFQNISNERILHIKNKYKITDKDYPIIGVISRYVHWKGIQYIIPAFEKLLVEYPNAKLILANAQHGDNKDEIKKLLKKIPQKNYIEIPFENDVPALYKIFNVFVHVPIDNHSEAFGQVYIEALLAGIPCIFTLSGVANEFIIDKYNALVVPYKNSESIYESIKIILSDNSLVLRLRENGNKTAQNFNLEKMIHQLENLYQIRKNNMKRA
ncbi:MAG TPA: glycosyltransferase family 4 protein [Bacteroidia bacterium]|nr:glycosyltransferase family 4 protein [Bacteroidia bacterium]